MTYPTPYVVGVHFHSRGAVDAHNNSVDVFIPSLDEDGTPLAVIGWQPAQSSEPSGQYEERVIVDLELLVPPSFPARERDVIDLPDGLVYPSAYSWPPLLPAGIARYRVVGAPRDMTKGPFGFQPGKVLMLRRVDG